jgi:sensor histidine kinase YesM
MILGAMRVLISGGKYDLLDAIISQLPVILVFYANYFVLLYHHPQKRYVRLILWEILIFIGLNLTYYVTSAILGPLLWPDNPPTVLSLSESLISSLWGQLIFSFFSSGYYYANQSIMNARKLQQMEAEKHIVEKEKIKAEYAFLRAQINPHFLHNTLNFFYAKTLMVSEELSEGILTLCEIMRYSLNSSTDADFVPLSREIEHVNNVIRINQLRFSNRLQVSFIIDGDIDSVKIIPLVIITLVENAFKHGDLNDEKIPLTLQLTVTADNQIWFSTFNKKKKGPKEPSHGIGLDNTIKRLGAMYGDQYDLRFTDEGDTYAVTLVILSPEPILVKTH